MKKKVMVGLVSVVVAVALVFGGVTFTITVSRRSLRSRWLPMKALILCSIQAKQQHQLMGFKYRLARNRR